MATNREEILADFQACTGIDDVAECILHLEQVEWSLLDAINSVMPQDTQTLPSERQHDSSPVEIVDEVMDTSEPAGSGDEPVLPLSMPLLHPVSACADIIPQPSSSSPRMLTFNVEYQDDTFPLIIPDCETVATIKTLLHPQLGIPPCRQRLHGWRNRHVSDQTRLSSLNLPKENSIVLQCDEAPPPPTDHHLVNGDDSAIAERLTRDYRLCIRNETNKRDYTLNFPGTKTVQEVKRDVFTVTNIPVRHQMWTGWPESANDETMSLAGCGLDSPEHSLTLRSVAADPINERRRLVVEVGGSDSSAEEFEDANETFPMEEDMFIHDVLPKKIQTLMPDNIEDEAEALKLFTLEFSNRYGHCHPMFFQATLDDALREACNSPATERRPLAVYLHHDGSVLTNVFCTQVLCAESLVSYLSSNFITWAWDLTHESNRASFLSSVTRHFGSVAASTIRNFSVEQLPLLLVIMKTRSATEVFSIMHATSTLDELLTSLIQAVDVFATQQQIEMKEEEEREARESVKREQDMAYEESLMADRAKEEAKRVVAAEKEALEREEEEQKERVEKQKQEELALKEAMRKSLEESLPPEPDESSTDPVSHIKFRLPNGETLPRRFLASCRLRVLMDFLTVKDYSPLDYKVLSSWPRRDLTNMDMNVSLQQLKLYPQETVTLEQR